MAEEIWKDIEGFPNYQVSNFGRVRNKNTNRLLSIQKDSNNKYMLVTLWKHNKAYGKLVHRLVASAFLRPHPDLQVNHIDGDKTNNCAENLEWCSCADNIHHAINTGLFEPAKHLMRPIKIVETGEIFESIHACAKAVNGQASNIHKCLDDKYPRSKTHKGLSYEYSTKNEYDAGKKENAKPFLYDYQMDAVKRMHNGSILCGSVGSGKSRTGLFYYFKENGGWIDEDGYVPMKNVQDLYIVTTAKKRNDLEWDGELSHYHMSQDPKVNRYKNKVVVDSWNNLPKYKDITGAFFLFDEQRLVGNGAWTKSFLKIAKNNNWILLSATPGDTYSDYLPVFLANGFFKNRTEFNREHVIYSRYTKYPKIDGYMNTGYLDYLRDKILVTMDYRHDINKHHEDVYCSYDISKYKDVIRRRWDIFKDEPITQASGLCFVLRRIVNSDESRQAKLLEIFEDHPKLIVFYSFNYELDILKSICWGEGVEVAEYNGSRHQAVPKGDRWVYLCQYTSACEGWSCIQTDTIVFYSQSYSYKVMTQAAGRIDRLTTPFKDLYYYHLRSRSGIDLAISKALKNKKKFNETKWVKW